MKKGTKIIVGIGVLAVAITVLYFVNKKYGWVDLGSNNSEEEKAGATGCGCGK